MSDDGVGLFGLLIGAFAGFWWGAVLTRFLPAVVWWAGVLTCLGVLAFVVLAGVAYLLLWLTWEAPK